MLRGRHLSVLCGSASAAITLRCLMNPTLGRSEPSPHPRRPRGKPKMFVRDPGIITSIFTRSVYSHDSDAFTRKWNKFTTNRLEKLVVIADFDYSLTPAYKPTGLLFVSILVLECCLLSNLVCLSLSFYKGEQALSTHGLLMTCKALGPRLASLGRQIFEKYYPIEQSATLTNDEKLPFMIEWWTATHALFIERGISKRDIRDAVEASDLVLRDGFFETFELLARANVPTLIFSAGLYDVIHAVLDKEYAKTRTKTPPPNVHVISNIMRFDEKEKAVDFEGTLIHSLNKNATAVIGTEFWKKCQLEKRCNILLLGDSLSDCNMTNGLEFTEDDILRIGFLNEDADKKLDLYLQHFDVVLTNDSTLWPVELLLHQLEQGKGSSD
ncbi:hypothetical protein PsorP6_018000 [Peronosclerospora sorghi]|uniref:Uncharacterized protein n=1 Tax=Peronosclerospora sorghi TaxID=230839 RepID=A0ACC0WBL7_9STRA|nr:hypothetical protein PsorP6_018000 [Peronosclerospora sorghi]